MEFDASHLKKAKAVIDRATKAMVWGSFSQDMRGSIDKRGLAYLYLNNELRAKTEGELTRRPTTMLIGFIESQRRTGLQSMQCIASEVPYLPLVLLRLEWFRAQW